MLKKMKRTSGSVEQYERSNINVIWVSEDKEFSANTGTKTRINGETYHIHKLEDSDNKDVKPSPDWSIDLTQYQSKF